MLPVHAPSLSLSVKFLQPEALGETGNCNAAAPRRSSSARPLMTAGDIFLSVLQFLNVSVVRTGSRMEGERPQQTSPATRLYPRFEIMLLASESVCK